MCTFIVAPFRHDSQVIIDRIAVRIHLCADTGSALGLYFGDFGTAFKERLDQPYVFFFDWPLVHVFYPIGIVSPSRNQGSQQLYQQRGTHWTNSHVRFNCYVSTFR